MAAHELHTSRAYRDDYYIKHHVNEERVKSYFATLTNAKAKTAGPSKDDIPVASPEEMATLAWMADNTKGVSAATLKGEITRRKKKWEESGGPSPEAKELKLTGTKPELMARLIEWDDKHPTEPDVASRVMSSTPRDSDFPTPEEVAAMRRERAVILGELELANRITEANGWEVQPASGASPGIDEEPAEGPIAEEDLADCLHSEETNWEGGYFDFSALEAKSTMAMVRYLWFSSSVWQLALTPPPPTPQWSQQRGS
jgi:hypothetical protein